MIYFEIKGAIFDLDDTLLDNEESTGNGLHERSRLAVVHEVGKRYGIETLAKYSAETNLTAFRRAKVQTNESAFWQILCDAKVVDPEGAEYDHELIRAMGSLKNDMHGRIIQEHAKPIPYAPEFVGALARSGVRIAIASTAIAQHVDIFLGKAGLDGHFSPDRIKSFESITRPKPDPEVYNLAFESLGLAEEDRIRTCAFDDDPRGIAAAKAAGLYACGITTRHSRRELLSLPTPPDLVGDGYLEFAEYMGLNIQL